MKLYAICLVKNEDDVIEQTLTYATRYCDKIFVIDNGSTDRTWEIVQELALQHPQIVPFVQTLAPYDEGLRWLVYDAHHHEMSDTDWWLILDSDEFLAEDPHLVIQQAMREHADVINAWQIQFYYTEKDLQTWKAEKDSHDQSIFKRRRYYRIDWQESRLFRNQLENKIVFRQSKLLQEGTPWGRSIVRLKGRVARKRILNRHYQYRDPVQIEKRLKLRFGRPEFAAQVKSSDWHSVIRSSRGLNYHLDGEPWRFSISGMAQYYFGWFRYVFISRFLRMQRRLATLVDRQH